MNSQREKKSPLYRELNKNELISVIEGKGSSERIPILLHCWIHPERFGKAEENTRNIMDMYPEDARVLKFRMPAIYDAPVDDPEYRWADHNDPDPFRKKAFDERIVISDWSQLDSLLEKFPDPHYTGLFANESNPIGLQSDNRYCLGKWFYCLFERHWSLRGMTNALMDFYLAPDKVHRLYKALTEFYITVITRAKEEARIDGVFTSDDFGTQTSPFISPMLFREFFKPYYKKMIDTAHSLGIHFWLHSCGNIDKLIPDLIDLELDVIHPIQKYAMDENETNRKYGNDICIWAGFDVQRVIPFGTSADVRQEVRNMIDIYYKPKGRFMLTAGNAINGDCTIECLEALFDESFKYGYNKCSKFHI